MTPNKKGDMNLLKWLYNRKHKQRRSLIEKGFDILKFTFREIKRKAKMDVAIIPNFMTRCMMLHNLLNFQEELKTKNILTFLEEESMTKKENNYKDNHGHV